VLSLDVVRRQVEGVEGGVAGVVERQPFRDGLVGRSQVCLQLRGLAAEL